MRNGTRRRQNTFHGSKCSFRLVTATLFFCIALSTLNAADRQHGYTLFAGIEIIELAQNEFSALGADNFTFTGGFSLPVNEKTCWGIRYTGIGVELSEEHLQEPSPAFRG